MIDDHHASSFLCEKKTGSFQLKTEEQKTKESKVKELKV